MANKSISQLTAGSAVSGTDLFPDVQTAGVGPVKVTATQLATYFWNSPTLVTPSLGAATASSIAIAGATLGSNVLAVNGSAIMTSLALGGATIGSNNLAVTGTTALAGATTVSTGGLTIGAAGTTGGTIALKGSTAGTLTLQVPATVTDYSITLPSAAAAANGYILTSTTGGVTSWTNPTALGVDLDIGSTAITGGTTGRVLYDNAGVLGEYTVTGTAGSVVLSTSPTFTTSIIDPLVIGGTAASSTLTLQSTSGVGTSDSILFKVGNNGGTTAATIDTAGNLGLGVTPSAWVSSTKALEVGAVGAIGSSTNVFGLYTNAYLNSSFSYIYKNTNYATMYLQNANGTGQHQWHIAPSGTAGNAITFTQAMTLDASGNLGIGTSSPTNIASYTIITTDLAGGTGSGIYMAGNGTVYGRFLANSTACFMGARTGQYLSLEANGAEKARIDTSGNLLLGGTAARGTTVGTAHLDIFDGTAPAGTLTNGISLYSSSGDFHFMDATGAAYKVGYRNIPQNAQTSAYVAAIGDVGEHISITTGGVTVNASIFSAGDVFTMFNNSASTQSLTQGASVTLRLAGTSTTGTRTVAAYGLATVLCIVGGATPTFVVSGNVT